MSTLPQAPFVLVSVPLAVRGSLHALRAVGAEPRAPGGPSWQDSVANEHLREMIIKGGPALKLSPGMPANPDLASKPAILDELVKLVRSMKGHS